MIRRFIPRFAVILVAVVSVAFWSWILVSFLSGSPPPLWPFTPILVAVWFLALRAFVRYRMYRWLGRRTRVRERHDTERLEAWIDEAQGKSGDKN